MLNTYYPPTQPTLRRWLWLWSSLARGHRKLGREKIRGDRRFKGTVYFVLDEELDRGMLAAMEKRTPHGICGWPESNSNWAAQK